MDTLVQLTDVTKRYDHDGTPAVAHVSLGVAPGEAVAVMGPSGSGKTTLLNLLAGLDRPTSGELWLQGQDMATLSSNLLALFRRRNLGFVFQDFNLLDTLTLGENIALPLSLDGKTGKEI